MLSFFKKTREQKVHYADLIGSRRTSRFFSYGYHDRFDPFLLDKKPFLRDIYNELFKALFKNKAGKILDVGCGTGLYWPVLKNYGNEIIGIDSSEAMIKEARHLIKRKKLSGVNARVQNCEDIDMADESFDSVLCVDVLHHIPNLKSALKEFHRILKPGGRLIAIEPNMFNPILFLAHLLPPEERFGIIRNYSPILKKLLRPYFKDICIGYVNCVFHAQSANQMERVKAIGTILVKIPFLRILSLRQTLSMVRL
jgi:ubiquinone/menaquinone biosynthesis C-methylase UbiE